MRHGSKVGEKRERHSRKDAVCRGTYVLGKGDGMAVAGWRVVERMENRGDR